MLRNIRHVPGPPLSAIVENLWLVQGRLASSWKNLILPDGAVELIFNLGGPQYLCRGLRPNDHETFEHSCLSGERLAPIMIDERGSIDLVGVRFRPGGAFSICGFPMEEVAGQVVELEAVLGREIELVRERLGTAASDQTRFAILEDWLIARRRQYAAIGRTVSHAVARLSQPGERIKITALAAGIGVTQRQLARDFARWVGVSPKQFARICAFQQAVKEIGFAEEVDWADLAHACGYFDQAHFIHEFQSFSGLTPTAYLRRRSPFLNYLTVPAI